MYESLIIPAGPSTPKAAAAGGGSTEQFVRDNLSLAQKVSSETGVSPNVLLGQWGLETGWGKSVIPGTNNLGNIKDFSGKGPVAIDNMTKSSDAYMKFATPDEFGSHFGSLLGRRYKTAMNAGDDSQKFFTELKRGGYAEDPGYIQKGVSAANMVAGILGEEGRQLVSVRGPAAGAATGAAPAEAYYTPSRGQYASLIVAPEVKRTALESAKDSAVALGSGLAAGVGMLASAAGADNAVARGASDLAQTMQGYESDYRKQQRGARAQTIADAESSGSTWNEIVANLGALTEAPVDTMLGAIGSTAPTLLTALIPGIGAATIPRLILQGAVGAVQGAGAVKGSIYEAVEQKVTETLVAKGMAPELAKSEAAKVAAGAQAYEGENAGQIAWGAALGGLAGSTGAEAILAGATKAAGKSVLARAAGGALAEAPIESAQGGQERLAANIALQNEGYDVPTMQGVAGQAALEGAAGGIMGAGFGAIARPELNPARAKALEPNSPLSKAAVAGNTGEAADEKYAQEQAQILGQQQTEAAAAQPQPDLILGRVGELEGRLRQPGAMDALRADTSPSSVKEVIKDLATAKSPSAQPAVREQAIARLEYALEWAGVGGGGQTGAAEQQNVVAATEDAGGQPANKPANLRAGVDRDAELQAQLAAAGTDFEREQIRGQIQANAEMHLGRSPAPAATKNVAATADPAMAAAESQAVIDAAVKEGKDNLSKADAAQRQTTVSRALKNIDERGGVASAEEAETLAAAGAGKPYDRIDPKLSIPLTADQRLARAAGIVAGKPAADLVLPAPSVKLAAPAAPAPVAKAAAVVPDLGTNQPAMGTVATPRVTAAPGPGTAVFRKRRAELMAVAEGGLTSVEHRKDGFYLVDGTRRKQYKLQNAVDAQLARKAIKDMIDAKANAAATSALNDRKEPTPAQIDAVNWKKGDKFQLNGQTLVIENPAGSTRKSKPGAAVAWETKINHHYGDIAGTKGADGDPVDVFVGNRPDSDKIFVIDQMNKDGSFDEHKVMMGFTSEQAARDGYLSNYEKGWTGLGTITEMSIPDFNTWVKSDAAQQPLGANDGATGRSAKPAAAARSGQQGADAAAGVADRNDRPGARDGGTGGGVSGKPGPANAGPVAADSPDAGADYVTIQVDGKPVQVELAKVSGDQPEMLRAIGKLFGKEVEFFKSKDLGDGFVTPGDDAKIYLNETSSISPLAVFGHEFLHKIEKEMPEVHAALVKIVNAKLKADGRSAFRRDYYGKPAEGTDWANAPLNRDEANELTSDIGGNLMSDKAFWQEVFAEVDKVSPAESKGLIAKMANTLYALLDDLLKTIRQQKFKSTDLIVDMERVRFAFKDGLAKYIVAKGITRPAMQAEILKAGQVAKRSASRSTNQIDTQAFKAWFGDSKVVDDAGKPLVVYHGTDRGGHSVFQVSAGSRDVSPGIWFTSDQLVASTYAGADYRDASLAIPLKEKHNLTSRTVYKVFLSIQNPMIVNYKGADSQGLDKNGDDVLPRTDAWVAEAISKGHDGLIIKNVVDRGPYRPGFLSRKEAKSTIYVALEPEQIKSAIGNNGDFDVNNSDIRKSEKRDNTADEAANDSTGELGRSPAPAAGSAPDYGTAREGAVSVLGRHYSTAPRNTLTGAAWGRGLKGAERERLADATDSRLRHRIAFYIDNGKGIRAESGVGGYAHEVRLNNIYDPRTKLVPTSADLNKFESAVIDAGFDGYMIPNFTTTQGAAVLLGPKHKAVPVKPVGQPANAPLPQDMEPTSTSKGLMSKELNSIDAAAIPGATLKAGTLTVPRASYQAANDELQRIGSPVRFSKARANDAPEAQYAAVEKALKGTDAWMKAPNGKPTALTERQWVHVRTPAFKDWFGDWESFAGIQGGVWNDGDGTVSKAVDANGEPLVVYHGTDTAGFSAFNRPGGEKRGDIGIYTSSDLSLAKSYVHRGRANMVTPKMLNDEETGGERTPGIYAMFMNLRNPGEDDFQGANFDGTRFDQFMVFDQATGESMYRDDGQDIFNRQEADAFAAQSGGDVQEAPPHWGFSDDVVRDARRMGSDGAILRNMIDDGGGAGYYGDPANVFVAFEPGQLKSADFNNGEYSVSNDDIRQSAKRDQTETPAFKAWFGDSRVVDDAGKPLVVYHGTSRDFDTFRDGDGAAGKGIYFSPDARVAGSYSMVNGSAGARTLPVHLSIVNPFALNETETPPSRKVLEKRGHDGIIYTHTWNDGTVSTEYIAFRPEQIKSAIGNDGNFDPASSDITRSSKRDTLRPEVVEAAGSVMRLLLPAERAKLRVDTATKLVEQFKALPSTNEMAAVAFAGKAKRGWYDQSARAIEHVFGPDAPRFAALLAAMSPQTSVETNLRNALNTWKNWIADGRPANRGAIFEIMGRSVEGSKLTDSVLPAWVPNSVRALTAINPSAIILSGPKVNSFMLNLRGNVDEVTNDAWMANYALVDQKMFSGGLNVAGTDPGKGPGYLAMSAKVRDAARRLTQLTGDEWTPAEVQETVWSWAKTLFELQNKDMGARELLDNKAVTDELIASTPDFSTQLREERNEDTLQRAGYGEQVGSLGSRADLAAASGEEPAARSQAKPFDPETQGRLERRAGARLEQLRGIRADAEAETRELSAQFSTARDVDRSGLEPGLTGLPTQVEIPGYGTIAAGRMTKVVEVAANYLADAGIAAKQPKDYVKVDKDRAERIAAAYEAMPHAPQDPAVQAAYKAMAAEVAAQYQAVLDAGLKVEFIDLASGDPYAASPRLMTEDVRKNNHMYVFSTRDGFGSSDLDVAGNPLLAETEFEISGQPALVNDLFRVVHDYFGHVKEGLGFRADGEENAWRTHSAMFTPLARRAMTTETRGQNSWVNYGSNGEANRKASAADTVYADQKTGLLPEWVSEDGVQLSRARATLDDFSADKIEDLLQKDDWAILTAENPNAKPATPTFNRAAMLRLRTEIVRDGFEFKPAQGKYDNEENSLAVVGIDEQRALALGAKYGQESVLTHKGLVYRDGSITPATGVTVFDKAPDNYYSKIGDTIFSIDLDFDATTAADTLASVRASKSRAQQPVFYSQLQRAIEGVPERLSAMGAPQWKLWLDANAGKLGVKKDEIEWSGIKDYLDTRGKTKVTRDELAAYMRDNGVQVRDVVLGGPVSRDAAIAFLRANDNLGFDSATQAYREILSDYKRDPDSLNNWDVSDDDRVKLKEMLDANESATKYAEYVVPGGENYREMLITLPVTTDTTGWTAKAGEGDPASGPVWEVRDAQGKWVMGMPSTDTPDANDAIKKAAEKHRPAGYASSHWDQRNILAHLRVDDRIDVDGKRVLFINEIQSDWGQSGKKNGFKITGQNARRAVEERDNFMSGKSRKYDGKLGAALLQALSADETREFESLQQAARESSPGAVPTAPFVGKTEAWVGLALKRAIVHAAQNGYDKVALINGEQAAGLYDLSKRVDQISVESGDQDGRYDVVVNLLDGGTQSFRNKTPAEVEDTIGKELAKKGIETADSWVEKNKAYRDALRQEGVPGSELDALRAAREAVDLTMSGVDLQIGGEGMKTFYDKIVPQVVSDVLKKLGGGKVGEVDIVGQRFRGGISGEDVMDALGIPGPKQGDYWRNLDGRERDTLIENERVRLSQGTTQPGFDITTAMREKLASGAPLFSAKRDGGQGNDTAAQSDQAQAAIDSAAFKAWFGDSKVVDDAGKPLVVYHGTDKDFDAFAVRDVGFHFGSASAAGWRLADKFGDEGASGARVMPLYLSIKNPLRMPDAGDWDNPDQVATAVSDSDIDMDAYERAVDAVADKAGKDFRAVFEKMGYDGIVYDNEGESSADEGRAGDSYIAFRPEQIKSAIGNNGGFDQSSADITRSKIRDMAVSDGYRVADFLDSAKTVSWWDKSVGTPFNLSERHPEFKRVYTAVQTFISDVSKYATRAADMAPNILPKLEHLKDIWKSPLSAADVKALAGPIFQGTLSYARARDGNVFLTDDVGLAGVVWKDDELRKMFNLDDRQIALYREFRKATNKSISDLAITDIIRYAGKDALAVRDEMLEVGVKRAVEVLGNHLADLAKADPERAYALQETARVVKEKAGAAQGLVAKGYAPLSRFGDYTVYVTRDGGKDQVFFGMYETQREANKAAREMREEFPDADVKSGTMSKEAYKLFRGITPETLSLFGESLGLEESATDRESQVFQEYLKLAKASRSAMKRLIERKGIAGFSEDASRVLAGFVYGNARQAASNLNAGEIAKSANDVKDGDLKDQAIKLTEYIQNPQEEAQAIRGLLFTQYIGGSLASAATNLTQSLTTTLPTLTMHFGIGRSSTAMASALNIINRGAGGDGDLEKAIKRAELEGITAPQEVHHLMAQAAGRAALRPGDGTYIGDALAKAGNGMSKIQMVWGKAFGWAEIVNRKVAFISAYKLAREKGVDNPFDFASKIVAETQYTMNKGNANPWARGPVGATIFTFRKFMINYIEGLARMWGNGPEGKKAFALSLAILFMVAGVGGLPFVDDLDDIIDGFAQRVLNKSFSSKAERKAFFARIIGDAGADFVMSGASGLPGAPIDVSGRLGLGNLIPGTGFFPKKRDYSRDAKEVIGVGADFAGRMLTAAGAVAQGDLTAATQSVIPIALANAWKAKQMAELGVYQDIKGRKVVDVTAAEAMMKAIGFQPSSVKKVQEATSTQQSLIAQNKLRESEIADRWAKGRIEKKPALVEDAKRQLREWNEANPYSPITIDQAQINRRVQQGNMSKAQRIEKTAPKEIKASVKAELAREIEN